MTDTVNILGIVGSLRQGSLNRKILNLAIEMKPDNMHIEQFDLAPLPFYNQDLVVDKRFPQPVQAWREALRRADGLLVACPEYNYSVTGVLKNALDWGSRPDPGEPPGSPYPLRGKPAALMGVGGRYGTVRSQLHFRQIAVFLDMPVMLRPEVYVTTVPQPAFDEEGRLINETSRQLIEQLVHNLGDWVRRFRQPMS